MEEQAMQSDDQERDQLARELLARTRLLEVARGGSSGPWRVLWQTRIRPLFVAFGVAVLTLSLMESAGHAKWLVVGGMCCLVAGLTFRPETARRIDALVDLLERKGALSAGSDSDGQRPV